MRKNKGNNQHGGILFFHFNANLTGKSVNIRLNVFSWSVGSEMLFHCVDIRMCSVVFILTPVLQASCFFFKIMGSCLIT